MDKTELSEFIDEELEKKRSNSGGIIIGVVETAGLLAESALS